MKEYSVFDDPAKADALLRDLLARGADYKINVFEFYGKVYVNLVMEEGNPVCLSRFSSDIDWNSSEVEAASRKLLNGKLGEARKKLKRDKEREEAIDVGLKLAEMDCGREQNDREKNKSLKFAENYGNRNKAAVDLHEESAKTAFASAELYTAFDSITSKLSALLKEKNRAYGNSFNKTGAILAQMFPSGVPVDKIDDMLYIVRVLDKLMRIASDKGAFGEDPLQDVAGYSVLALARQMGKKGEVK